MYIVLTAMLALNVSSDVLNGFSQVQAGLQKTSENLTSKNEAQYRYLQLLYDAHPQQVGPWMQKGSEVRKRTNDLYAEIENLKIDIARKADGRNADYRNLINQDDLEASSVMMLNPTTRRGENLRKKLDAYRTFILKHIDDPDKRKAVENLLSTSVKAQQGTIGPSSWEQANFENMPVIASITFLTHLQTNLRQAESEAMSNVINTIDMGEAKVNQMSAYVIPRSTMIMSGGRYEADIVLAAVDTTRMPRVFVGGREIPGGKYAFNASGLGNHDFAGFIEVLKSDGSSSKYPFKSSYTVIEPMATISPTMMNVLYAGIDNPVSISVPGVPTKDVSATMTNGTLSRHGDSWTARPAKVGENVTVTVTANIDGRPHTVATTTFRVRRLPDPTAYLTISGAGGAKDRYKGGKPISKATLASVPSLQAAIDDDMLDIDFQVLGFETVFFDQMGNAIPEVSRGAEFSQRQRDQFKRIARGKRFYISRIRAKGPDGIERILSPMEVIVN